MNENSKSHIFKEDILCCGSGILIVVERFEVECLDSGPWVENLIPESPWNTAEVPDHSI